jgi:histidinol-phosphate/aromatic aminotransferase/cobyric acid decarboxylase-like protein
MTECLVPLTPRLCFNWLPRYRYALLLYKALQQACAARVFPESSGSSFSSELVPGGGSHLAPVLVRPVLTDMVLKSGDWCGYLRRQFEPRFLEFKDHAAFYPLTEDLALIAGSEGAGDLLNNAVPYMSPAPQTLGALLAVAGGYTGCSPERMLAAHDARRAAAAVLQAALAALYAIEDLDLIRLHPAGVGGLIEAVSRYLLNARPGYTTCVLTPEYWDLLRCVLTYSRGGLRPVPGREQEVFPAQAWLAELSRADLDFAYLSYTSNPLGTTVPWQDLLAALDCISDKTLFFLDCTSFDTEDSAGPSKLTLLLRQFAHKNLVIAKSFSKEYDLGDLRIGYALFTRAETAQAVWPYMASYPPEAVSRTALQCLRRGNAPVMADYRRANQELLQHAKHRPQWRISGACSNYTTVFFPSEEAASAMLERLRSRYGEQIYPGELPMQGGGDIGLGKEEIDLTTMKRIPFLSKNALRLMVGSEAVQAFFGAA